MGPVHAGQVHSRSALILASSRYSFSTSSRQLLIRFDTAPQREEYATRTSPGAVVANDQGTYLRWPTVRVGRIAQSAAS